MKSLGLCVSIFPLKIRTWETDANILYYSLSGIFVKQKVAAFYNVATYNTYLLLLFLLFTCMLMLDWHMNGKHSYLALTS